MSQPSEPPDEASRSEPGPLSPGRRAELGPAPAGQDEPGPPAAAPAGSAPEPRPPEAAPAAQRPAGPYPVAGEFVLGSQASPVAVCALASQSLLPALAGRPEIAIAGRVYTENLGIEKMVQNLLANPTLRVLIVCGRESRHRVGQAILSLHRNGLDPLTRRIQGATGPEPILAGLSLEQAAAFQQRFEVIDLIGEQDPERILAQARASLEPARPEREPAPPPAESAGEAPSIAAEPDRPGAWVYDRLGFFLLRVDRERRLLLLEHYGQDRRLLHRLHGDSAAALAQTAVRLGLLGELSHAAYLGRELAKAEAALRFDLHYEQDSPLRTRGAEREGPSTKTGAAMRTDSSQG
jgi:tetrahydromethanopterin S-methyltransferase subunit A